MDDLFENIIQEKANKFFNSVEKTTKKNKKVISEDKKDEILNRLRLGREKRQQNIRDKKEQKQEIKQEPIKQDNNNYMEEITKLKSELESIKKQKEEPKKEVKTYDKLDDDNFDLPETKIEKPILPQKIKPTYVFSHFTTIPYY